ncbi:TIGR03571 family LLM class oxidoreductase [Cupriavidus sp. AU9028]|uniref:TIGR03571 family LLM class oxidoreductase n=1 Tax=Cupriavidus sp. AU9028 TaxID=2871157 RepID=UPI001C980EED|nr:TIGR03571 family LLM class oxidoreductase [Cupriavidus sp. AU9028]MBY4898545.1 TIGR03571 family LLM class oxidoreductase [Cupriavidus sp. AU9028]
MNVESDTPAGVDQVLFRQGEMGIGLVMPLVRPGTVQVDLAQQLALAVQADQLGFDALWIRDVPLNTPDYPDPLGHIDPWVALGALAVRTQRIALVTGAIVLTLRHPLHVAKAAVSVGALSEGRLLLGLGSGDRPAEYAAFGRAPDARRALFRHNWDIVAAALAPDSRIVPDLVPMHTADGPAQTQGFTLLPRPARPVPMLTVGSAGQSVEWIAAHSIGWATYHRAPEIQRERYRLWRRAVERIVPEAFRSFSVSMRLELDDDPDAPPQALPLGYRAGSRTLVPILEQLREEGTHHVALNLAGNGRPHASMLDELADAVLPAFRRGA